MTKIICENKECKNNDNGECDAYEIIIHYELYGMWCEQGL